MVDYLPDDLVGGTHGCCCCLFNCVECLVEWVVSVDGEVGQRVVRIDPRPNKNCGDQPSTRTSSSSLSLPLLCPEAWNFWGIYAAKELKHGQIRIWSKWWWAATSELLLAMVVFNFL